MSMIEKCIEAARGRSLSVVLPESGDERMLAAARRLVDEGIARPILIGSPDDVAQAAKDACIGLDGIEIIDSKESDKLDVYTAAYIEGRDLKESIARRMVRRPLYYAGMMVAQGDADTMVAGVVNATALVIQAGVMTVGLAEGIKTPSSFFLMILPEFHGVPEWPFIYADCAVNISPTSAELADIAIASEKSARSILDDEPRVAMLSFSTKGSAAHEDIDLVSDALKIVRSRATDLNIDGEFQVDTAIIPDVAMKKVKEASVVAGRANVLIFPDLNSGNIGYKLTQYMGGAQAIGPFLQGFARPISDLSRGASVDDIVATTAICLAQVSGS